MVFLWTLRDLHAVVQLFEELCLIDCLDKGGGTCTKRQISKHKANHQVDQRKTYKYPRPRTPISEALTRLFILRFQTRGIGKVAKTTSVAMLIPGFWLASKNISESVYLVIAYSY